MKDNEEQQQIEEYAHEFGINPSIQESDAKIDLTKFLLSQKNKKKEKNKKEEPEK